MAGLKDRLEKEVSPTAKAVLGLTGNEPVKKDKYPVNVIFNGEMEPVIKARAKELGVGVATYIKMLVSQDLKDL